MSKLKIEDVLKNINDICKERKIKFNCFCTKDGEDIEWHGNRTYLRLECLICGYKWFSTDYEHLIHRGYGCKACKNAEHKMSEDEYMAKILDRCKERNYTFLYFCDKYGNKCEWIDARLTCLMLRCNICGNIWRVYYGNFIYFNNGCLKCAGIKFNKEYRMTEEERNNRIKQHCDKYNCTFVCFCDKNGNEHEYHNMKTCVKFKCNICGEYNIMSFKHIIDNGLCKKCVQSRLENDIELFLKENNIDYEKQKHFPWLGKMSLDFYLPKYNIGIECQGIQHFKALEYFGGEERLNETIERDKRKMELCNINGIKLLYYSNLGIDYPYSVFEDKEKILKIINKI